MDPAAAGSSHRLPLFHISQAIPAVIGSISYTVWNWRYYSSREELFVN